MFDIMTIIKTSKSPAKTYNHHILLYFLSCNDYFVALYFFDDDIFVLRNNAAVC